MEPATVPDRADPQADQQAAACVAPDKKHKKDVVQYSRRPVPTSKQKEQAAQSQYLLDMKEYFAEVPSPSEFLQILCETALILHQHSPTLALAAMHQTRRNFPILCLLTSLIRLSSLVIAHFKAAAFVPGLASLSVITRFFELEIHSGSG